MYHVYILRCSDGSLYVGSTDNLASRIRRHNEGRGARHTVTRRPVRLTYAEPHPDRSSALRREQQLKRWTAAKKEALCRGDLAALHRLAKRRS